MSDRLSRATIPLLLLAACGILAACGLLAACGNGDERTVDLTDVRDRKDAGPVAPGASTTERFRFATDAREVLAREKPPEDLRWEWATPAGWTETGGSQFREMGWTVASSPDLQASFSLAGGGALANLNRWRSQMDLPGVDEAALSKLEKRTFLGQEVALVDLAGTYSSGGMSGPAKKLEGARMLGLIVEIRGTSAFLKLTGPAAAVDAEKERFLALAASVRPGKAETPRDPHGAPDPHAPPAPDRAAGTAPFQWTAPEGWTKQPDRAMRIATYRLAGAKEAEVVISRFPGAVGGLKENLRRWREQMGLGPLSDAEIEALPRTKALGLTAVLVSMDGGYGGMDGTAGKEGWTFLGAVIQGEEYSVFVKMVGPTAEVRPEEKRFRDFVESLRE